MSGRFGVCPSTLSRAEFLAAFGGVYEHSPWIAERLWEQGIKKAHRRVDALATALAAVVDAASRPQRLALIRAHPDLAGRAAVAGTLTEASSAEQASAGIDGCTPAEFARFEDYNRRYKEKFGFPFIMAVRGSSRSAILEAFGERLQNDVETEFAHALTQVHRIARWRLEALAAGDDNA